MHQTLATVGCPVLDRVTSQDWGGGCRKVGVKREGSLPGWGGGGGKRGRTEATSARGACLIIVSPCQLVQSKRAGEEV